ncbi:mitochondrial carrier domain-containing protein [Dipodascopsis uninucleata]
MGLWRAAKSIYDNDGLIGLFQGHSATLLRIFPYAAIKFVVYEQIRSVLIRGPDQETNGRRILSGSLAGVSSVFFTYPLELIRVRLAYETRRKDRKTGFLRTCRDIFSEDASKASEQRSKILGIRNFYRGFAPTVLGMLPYAGVSFWTHDTFHDIFRSPLFAAYTVAGGTASSDRHTPLTVWAQLTAGGLAGMISQTASYPLEVIRRRMQVGGIKSIGTEAAGNSSIAKTARIIYGERGLRGFFVGLTIGYIKVIPMVSCSFFVYERMKIILGI